MFRKTIFAVAAVATLTAAALVPTTASAHGFRGGWYGGWGFRSGIILSAPLVYSCVRLVETRRGLRYVNVCY